MVYGGYRHDRSEHFRRDVYFRPGSRHGWRIFLYADGARLFCRIDCCGACPDTDVLSDEPCEHLRLFGKSIWLGFVSHGSLVLFRVENAWRVGAVFRGMRRVANVGVRATSHAVCVERHTDGRAHLALFVPRRGEVAHLDGFA